MTWGLHQSEQHKQSFKLIFSLHRITIILFRSCSPAGIWCRNDIRLMLMRRNDVASMSVLSHFDVMCPLDPSSLGIWTKIQWCRIFRQNFIQVKAIYTNNCFLQRSCFDVLHFVSYFRIYTVKTETKQNRLLVWRMKQTRTECLCISDHFFTINNITR